jgi:hypothetical protein
LRDDIDYHAVANMPPAAVSWSAHTNLLARLVRSGVNLLVREEDGSYALPDLRRGNGMHELGITSGDLRRLSRFYGLGRGSRAVPEFRSQLGLDTVRGEYDLRRIELGTPGGRLWLIHDLGDEAERGFLGLQLRYPW